MSSIGTFLDIMSANKTRLDLADVLNALVAVSDEQRDRLDQQSEQITRLERRAAQQENTITKLQQALIKAGKFEHADPQKRVEGLQFLLQRAGETKGRERKGRR
jgi:uncharacterized coiled-coil protein SlyX